MFSSDGQPHACIDKSKVIPLKKFLSHVKTKQDLTIYLSKNVIKDFIQIKIEFVVTYDLCSESNIPAYPSSMMRHDHEEADTLLVLQAIDVAKNHPFTECIIYSPDTDVFLLLIHFYEKLPQVYFLYWLQEMEQDF